MILDEIKQCIACEQSTEAMRKVLNNPKADHSKKHVLEKACRALPKKYMKVVSVFFFTVFITQMNLLISV